MAAPDCWGAGSPSSVPGGSSAYFDWGAGAPTPAAGPALPLDYGAGDPSQALLVAYIIPIAADHAFPDDGGELVVLKGNWSVSIPTALGPYRVQLQDSFTSAYYPPTTEALGCYSGLAGKGIDCEVDINQEELRFALPTAPPGVYDVIISYGPSFGYSFTISKGLRIIRRGRVPAAWRLRGRLPPSYIGSGPRDGAQETLQGAS